MTPTLRTDVSSLSTEGTQPTPVALVIGAGDATGGAIARRFAQIGRAHV